VIDVATLSVIRRWALREQLSIREIARRTGLSRNTIRKYLRAGEAEPHYAKRVSPSKLDPFALKLSGWLKTEAGRSRKQRRTVKQMYADLQALGYTGSYNRVAAFARLWQEQRLVAQQTTGRGTFVPLAFGPGEAFQFDWSEDWAVLAACAPSCRWPTSSSATAGRSTCAPIRCRRTRCCSMPTTMRSSCWAVCPAEASTTTCAPL
jgi:transcriptional regulator with XRE-family HTH domain